MFNVYTFRIDSHGRARYFCFRKNITKSEAEKIAAARNKNPNRSVKYYVVADKNLEKFAAWAEATAKPFREKYEAKAVAQAARWNYAEKMAWRGYKCQDVIAFVKGSK